MQGIGFQRECEFQKKKKTSQIKAWLQKYCKEEKKKIKKGNRMWF